MVLQLPLIGICPTRFATGLADASPEALERATVLQGVDLREALETRWTTDAHFVQYRTIYEGKLTPDWMRINQSGLWPFRDVFKGDVVSTIIVLDYDNPGHAPWAPEGNVSKDGLLERIARAADEGFELAKSWYALYFTRHGMRLIYVLAEPFPVERFGGYFKAIVRAWAERGIQFDEKVSDWTRLMRLPSVKRSEYDGSEAHLTWKAAYWEEPIFQSGVTLDHRTLDADLDVDAVRYGKIRELDLPMPSQDDAYALLTGADGKPSAAVKAAKKALTGTKAYPVCFEYRPIADVGGRDSAIQELVGLTCKILHDTALVTPELVYSLFLPSVEQLEPDAQTPCWLTVLWAAVLKWWAREEAKQEYEAQQERERVAASQTLQDRVLSGYRSWCDRPELMDDDNVAIEWVRAHSIAATSSGKSFYVLGPNGFFDQVPCSGGMLATRIRELGMDSFIPIEQETQQGTSGVPERDIIRKYATIVSEIEGLVYGQGCTIRNVGHPSATFMQLLYSRRTDLTPTYSPEVNQWLMHLGGDRFEELCEWISLALAFEEGPICALSIAGKPGCGKKMLVQGLAECITTQAIAGGEEMGQFQSQLMRTPFLWINEGFPTIQGARHPADTFRALVGGDPMSMRRLFRDSIIVRNPVRMVFAANNVDVIQLLTAGRDLTPDDKEALAVRLFHIDATRTQASLWLKMQGGLAFTSAKGRRWIRGDHGAPSDYVVAKHFMWLYERRPQGRAGRRLLMEGSHADLMVAKMVTRSGSAPSVIEALCHLIEQPRWPETLVVAGGAVHVTVSAVMDHWRSTFQKTASRGPDGQLSMQKISAVFQGLHGEDHVEGKRRISLGDGKHTDYYRWHTIDPEILLEEAERFGVRHPKLSRIVKEGWKIRMEAAAEAAAEQDDNGEELEITMGTSRGVVKLETPEQAERPNLDDPMLNPAFERALRNAAGAAVEDLS